MENANLVTTSPKRKIKHLWLKLTALILLGIIAIMILTAGGYVAYVVLQYSRIEDNKPLTVQSNKSEVLQLGTQYSIITYNIGFGAYDPDYSFFMDTGTMKDGSKVSGKYGKGASKERVQANTDGSVEIVRSNDADFYLLQEVDEKASRSYGINQLQAILGLWGYGSTYAQNFNSAYLAYPLNDPHGKTQSGIVTLSKYKIDTAVRRQFPVTDAFFAKFFDLDRCFSLHTLSVAGGKSLTLINLHMSAYDEGGTIRALQLAMLNEIMEDELEKGNYVIAGGDFNHDIAGTINAFPTEQNVPEWVYQLSDDDLTAGMRFVGDATAPSCRSADIPYEQGVNYTASIDGFAVSQNISTTITTLSNGFLYSDHHPVKMTFTLN